METVFVSVGSNVDRERHIVRALDLLRARFGELRRSSVYESASVGFDGDPFFNLVVAFNSDAEPRGIVSALREVERKCGRDRRGKRFGPRTMDLDLLLVGRRVMNDGAIVLPHEEISTQAFVLCPLAEIAGGLEHPHTGVRFVDMWANMRSRRKDGADDLRRVEFDCGAEARIEP
jgi:2-amino-4-hydroxy-6-hydroxymethyldihydropteridine diphosphokinase